MPMPMHFPQQSDPTGSPHLGRGQPAPRATVDLRRERQTDGIPFSFP
jgi:hypothetical protein